jgi:hypothetical protein
MALIRGGAHGRFELPEHACDADGCRAWLGGCPDECHNFLALSPQLVDPDALASV